MMTSLRPVVLGLLLIAIGPAFSWGQGQGRGQTGSGSGTGSTGMTSGGTGGSTGTTFGGTSTGTRSSSGGASGATSSGEPTFTQFGQAAANIGTGFVGRANDGQTFVGQAAAGQQTIDAGGTARFSGLGGGGGGAMPSTNYSQARGGQMRIPRRIAFESPAIPAPVVQATVQAHFATIQNQWPGIAVQMPESGHLVLQGEVESVQARRIAEALARLEPGVRRVTNELVVIDAEPVIVQPRLVP